MANPFKESETKAKAKAKTIVTEQTQEIMPVVESEPVPKNVAKKEDKNLLAGMIEQKPEGKSCGFYLSSEAIQKLDNLAKTNKCSKSKALDTLLRSLL